MQELFGGAADIFAKYNAEILGIEKTAFFRDGIRLFSGFRQQRDSFLQTVAVQVLVKTHLHFFFELPDEKGFAVMQLPGKISEGELAPVVGFNTMQNLLYSLTFWLVEAVCR